MNKKLYITLLTVLFASNVFAENRTIELVVGYKTVDFSGAERTAIAVNGQIPAPTLHFQEGDEVTINVYNELDQETAVHWHGMLLPWQMDGVLGVTQKGIPPSGVFSYKFTLHQAGTYWYHAHAGLQEQQGFYGAFLIDPKEKPTYHYTKDYAIVLSDWSNTNPDKILANLKKDGDYYSPRFPLQPSLVKFIHEYRNASVGERKNVLDDYKMMQEMRMSIYDINDVAYDAFLLNGHNNCYPWTAPVKIGDMVRLRFIGAGGNTVFRVKIPDTTMQVVHVDGNDVEPYVVNDFTIAPGETYDVMVKIQKKDPTIIYAESTDTVGAAYGALVTQPDQWVDYAKVTPFPEPLPVTREMMSTMMAGMNHSSMSMNMNMTKSPMKPTSTNMAPMKMDHDSMSGMKKSEKSKKAVKKSTAAMSHDMPMDHASMTMPTEPTIIGDTMSHQSHGTMSMNNMTMENNNQQVKLKRAKIPSTNTTPMKMDPNMPMDHGSMDGMQKSEKSKKATKKSTAMAMSHDIPMDHASMAMPTEPTIIGDTMSPSEPTYTTTPGTKYHALKAAVETNDPNIPISSVIKMELFGYMGRFIWFINGVPEHEAEPIVLYPGKRYRIVFINNSMMHHPMHTHGHWFILRKGNGAYDPLLHTIDVPPGATITTDIDTDASGQWLFHCHFLYHMMTGMSRVLQYSSIIALSEGEATPQNIVKNTPYYNRPIIRVDEVKPIDFSLVEHPMPHATKLWLATFVDVGASFDNKQQITFKGLYGPDYNKIQLFTKDAEIEKGKVIEADMDIFYWHQLDQFWAIKGGANYKYRPAKMPYWQPGIGIEGVMPYFIDTDVRGYLYGGSTKLDIELSRDTQIMDNFFIRASVRSILASKTVIQADVGSGLNQMRYIVRPYYRLMPGLNLFAEFECEKSYGAFKRIQNNEGESAVNNIFTIGLSVLF